MTNKNDIVSISKFLSLVLRHQPQKIGLSLDDAGWADVSELLQRLAMAGWPVSLDLLQQVVAGNDKQRFSFSEDGARIRANQGHSIEVELGLEEAEPPAVLYHGTASRFIDSVMRTGLDKRQRHHVHMTADIGTARSVGQRYGVPVILAIDAAKMRADGHRFYRSDNNVWLTDHVPVRYLSRHHASERIHGRNNE
jgi:putative RNA 2'-phosphotransferase